jgi:hypothetical protein
LPLPAALGSLGHSAGAASSRLASTMTLKSKHDDGELKQTVRAVRVLQAPTPDFCDSVWVNCIDDGIHGVYRTNNVAEAVHSCTSNARKRKIPDHVKRYEDQSAAAICDYFLLRNHN